MSKPDIVDRLRSVDSQGIRGIAERVSELLLCRAAADEIERLRELLKECQEYVEAGMSSVDTELCDRVEKELSDE